MSNKDHNYYVGDRFIIEIGHSYWNPTTGNRYFIKGFDTLVFDDKGLDRLEKVKKIPKDPPHSCEYCLYEHIGGNAYPCSMCDKGMERSDMFEPSF